MINNNDQIEIPLPKRNRIVFNLYVCVLLIFALNKYSRIDQINK